MFQILYLYHFTKEKPLFIILNFLHHVQANKEEDDKMRTTAANVAARAAVGGDDMLSKWQLMAEQARQKREGGIDAASGSQPGKDASRKPSSTSGRNARENQEAEKRGYSTVVSSSGKAESPWLTLNFRALYVIICCSTLDVIADTLRLNPQINCNYKLCGLMLSNPGLKFHVSGCKMCWYGGLSFLLQKFMHI